MMRKKESRVHKIMKALVIGTAVILFWRGVWHLADIYLYPNDPLLSNVVSVVIGATILISMHKFVKELI